VASTLTEYDSLFKTICIGDSNVGKSSIVSRYVDDHLINSQHIPTIGVDFRIKTFSRNGKVVKLQIWDTAGQERFRSIAASYYRGASGIMMVFDLSDPASLESLAETWAKDVRAYAKHKPRILLVGNKSDLKVASDTAIRVRVLAEDLCQRLEYEGTVDFIETSAKSGENITDAFERLVDSMMVEAAKRRVPQSNSNRFYPHRISGSKLIGTTQRAQQKFLCCSLL